MRTALLPAFTHVQREVGDFLSPPLAAHRRFIHEANDLVLDVRERREQRPAHRGAFGLRDAGYRRQECRHVDVERGQGVAQQVAMTGRARGGEGAVELCQHRRDAGARGRGAVGRVAVFGRQVLRDGERKPFAALRRPPSIISKRFAQARPPSPASSPMRPNMRARVSGSAGTTRDPPAQPLRERDDVRPAGERRLVIQQHDRHAVGAGPRFDVGRDAQGANRQRRDLLDVEQPFAGTVHGLGSADATTIRKPRAAHERICSMSTYVSRSMGAKTSARDAAELAR